MEGEEKEAELPTFRGGNVPNIRRKQAVLAAKFLKIAKNRKLGTRNSKNIIPDLP